MSPKEIAKYLRRIADELTKGKLSAVVVSQEIDQSQSSKSEKLCIQVIRMDKPTKGKVK